MKLQHPDSSRTITVRDDMAAIYRTQGWREVESALTEEPAPARPRKPRAKK